MAAKQVQVVWGGWEGHTPKAAVDVFVPWLRSEGFAVDVAETLDVYLDAERMAKTDLIVQCWTMGAITAPQEKGLLAAVAAGTGLAGWHGGIIDAFRQNTNYQFMTGGQWVAHPGGCIPSYRVDIADPDHPVTRGIEAFELRDTEQYYIHIDPACHVLCTTTFRGEHGDPGQYPAGVVIPYAYTRAWGKGRVFVACWGHTQKDFEVEPARILVQRGLAWACR